MLLSIPDATLAAIEKPRNALGIIDETRHFDRGQSVA